MLHTLVKWTASARLLVALTHYSSTFTVPTAWFWAWPWKTFTALRVRATVPWSTMVWQPVAISRTVHTFFWTYDFTAVLI
jgi:hypothetical protein